MDGEGNAVILVKDTLAEKMCLVEFSGANEDQ